MANLSKIYYVYPTTDKIYFEVYTTSFNRRITKVRKKVGKDIIGIDDKDDDFLVANDDGIFFKDNRGRLKLITTYRQMWNNVADVVENEHFEESVVDGYYEMINPTFYLAYEVNATKNYIGNYGEFIFQSSGIEEWDQVGRISD